jgi:hypothetical protein
MVLKPSLDQLLFQLRNSKKQLQLYTGVDLWKE